MMRRLLAQHRLWGGSERQMYCMPYGICSSDTSVNGTGGFVRAGKGIQELAFGAFDADHPTTRILLGTQTLGELVDTDGRINYSTGWTGSDIGIDSSCTGGNCGGSSINKTKDNASGSGGGDVTDFSYILNNKRWFEQLPQDGE